MKRAPSQNLTVLSHGTALVSRIENGGEVEENWKSVARTAMQDVRPLSFR